ncbi:MAG: LysM peptidoglycan-binding domain-containing protein [Lachnospiraceae bacterium]|nr:LysM peptidoglycan-binding domain-containing protein [Lachnospiraceae bacterium]
MMKRLIITIALALMIIGIPMISEAKDREVTVTDATVTSTGATVSGTTDAPAVMVQIRNANDEIVAMSSFAVVNNTFNGTVSQSLTAGATYNIYVADYEGGPFSTAEGTVPEPPASSTPSVQPSQNSGGGSGGNSSGEEKKKVTVTEKRIYTVIKGDNLGKISKKLGVTLQELVTWNYFKNINLIYPGQQIIYYVTVTKDADQVLDDGNDLKEGGKGIYVVKKGDNLTKIARKLKVSLNYILKRNQIKNINLIYPGQKIKY